MDLSSDPSAEEARIMERQLYRPGQTTPAPKTPAPSPARSVAKPAAPAWNSAPKSSSSKTTKGEASKGKRLLLMLLLLGFGYYLLYGTPQQRKRVLIGLGMAAWLFFLGGVSYCLFLPDYEQAGRKLAGVWEDPNLSFDQKRDKMRETFSNLSPEQRRQVAEGMMKEREQKGNLEMHKFLDMSQEEQVEYLKKKDEERKKRFEQMRATWANGGSRGGGPGGGGPGGGNGPGGRGAAGGGAGGAGGGAAGGAPGGGGGGPGGGGPGGGPGFGRGGGGPGGGGPGGGGDRNVRSRSRLDWSSPESRAGRQYQAGMNRALGLGGGGFGGRPPR